MTDVSETPGLGRLATPRSAAVAGILFALLFALSLGLLRSSIPQGAGAGTTWLHQHRLRFDIGLTLMPFAGIAFLWFIGVVRDRIGALEDRFFSTVFLGSSLLFLAMVFVYTAIAGALVYATRHYPNWAADARSVDFGRALMLQIGTVYALRMAAVMMVSLATIWLRTRLMPRWLVILTYVLAVALLVVINADSWVMLVFPAWVFLVSLMILWREYRSAGPTPVRYSPADT